MTGWLVEAGMRHRVSVARIGILLNRTLPSLIRP